MAAMSIIEKKFSTAIVFAAILLLTFAGRAQEIEAEIKILSSASASVTGRFIKENSNQSNKNWSFTNTVAGIENLGARISEFNLSDRRNRPISFKKLTNGEYLADEEANFFSYRVDLTPLPQHSAMAHASWLADGKGLLMLGDLLPQFAADNQPIAARIKFNLSDDWKIISAEKDLGDHTFEIANVEKAIFLVGKNWREREIQIGQTNLSLTISGEWQVSDAEATEMTGEIAEEYRKLFGEIPFEKAQIFLMRFPKETKFGRWSAEARGANVTIFSGDMPFKTQSAQLLHEQLRHEIFHLWLPNNLTLTGNYDWFYEGFAIYQALRTGVSLNRIRFEDYLDTLAQAYHLENSSNQKKSLLESSKNRWSGVNNQIYARGMLAAFLCDVALLRESRGKRSISTIFREVYLKHRAPGESEDGNAAILKILKNYSELNLIIEKYVVGTEKINWETDLKSLGIVTREEHLVTKLDVRAKLNGKQKDLLNELGYNNWRKTLDKRK